MSDEPSARKLASQLKGLDSSGVEVDEEQEAPRMAIDSPEETDALAKMETLVQESGDADAIAADKATKLFCLRGRKFVPEAGAKVLSQLLALKKELGLDGSMDDATKDLLKANLRTKKLIATGQKDADGRMIICLRLRFHDPKTFKPIDMARLMTTVVLSTMKDPDAQRWGIVVVGDMSGISLKNLDPGVPKMMMGKVFPALPVRVGRMCIFNPPWIVGHIILPILFALMSKKLRSRIALIKNPDPEKLLQYVPKSALPASLDGTLALDEDAWAESMVSALP